MAARFWVGGTGTWDAVTTTHWSATTGGAGGASVPVSTDDVTLDGSSGGGTITVNTAFSVLTLTMGAYTGTLDFSVNNNSPTIGTFSGSGSAVRALKLGTGTFTITRATSGGAWDMTTSTNMTLTPGSSTLLLTGGAFCGFIGGGLTYNNVTFTPTGGGSHSITGTNTFANLTYNIPAAINADFSMAANQIVTGTFTTAGGTAAANRVFWHSNATGTPFSITAAVVAMVNIDFMDITGAGAATWSGTSIGDAGGNSGITFTPAVTRYWVGFSGGSWGTAANWSASNGGAGSASVPLCHDTAMITSLSITSGARTITANVPRIGSLDMSGVLNSPIFSVGSTTNSFFGATLSIPSSVTFTGNAFSLRYRDAATLNLGPSPIEIGISINNPTGTYTLAANLTMGVTRTLTVTNGTLNDGGFVISTGLMSIATGTTLTLGSVTHLLTGTGTIFTGSGTINANGSTLKITDTSVTGITFAGGGKTYNNLWFARGASTATNTITGANTFAQFKDNGSAAHTITFPNSTTTLTGTTPFVCTGSSGNVITLARTGASGTFTLSAANGGDVICDFLSISNSNALGGSTWYAGPTTHSTNGGTNSGWNFSAPDTNRASNFFNV